VKLKRRDSDLLYHLQGRQINEEKEKGRGGEGEGEGERREGGGRGKGLIGWVGVALIEVI
jgi:hypothetical protein